MEITLRYHLSTGEVVDWQCRDFSTPAQAQESCIRLLNTPNATASLNGPRDSRVVSGAHIVSITIIPAEGS